MIARLWCIGVAMAATIVACNALTGASSLSVEADADATDAATLVPEAGPAPTMTTTSVTPPTQPEAGPTDAAVDSAADATVDAGPPPNIGTFNGHRYEIVILDDAVDWNTASTAAQAKGGHLATITTAAENAFIVRLVAACGGSPNAYGPWIGGTKPQIDLDAGDDAAPPDPAANWSWVTGETWSYTDWAPTQPDNDEGDENNLGFLGECPGCNWNDYRETGDSYITSYAIEYEHL